jgi:hypothetical protein
MTPEELQLKTYELDLQRFAFEKERQRKEHDIEEKKLTLERHKAKWSTITVLVTAGSILASVSVAGLTIVESQRLQKQAADTQFELKAADLVLNSDDPEVNQNKAARFQELFPNRVPQKWAATFDWRKYAEENDAMKAELIKLLSEHPEQKNQVIDLYKRLFRDDPTVQRFINRIEPSAVRETPR